MTLLILSATIAMAANSSPGLGEPRLLSPLASHPTLGQAGQASGQDREQARKEGITREEMPAWTKANRSAVRSTGQRTNMSVPVLDRRQLAELAADNTAGRPVCSNGGFELGNFSGWHLYKGSFGGVGNLTLAATAPPVPTVSSQLTSQHTILPVPSWASNGNFMPKPGYTASTAPPGWNGAYDPIVSKFGVTVGGSQDIPLPFPGGGAHTLRLGNPVEGGSAEGAAMTFIVPPTMTAFNFQYAMVLEDPGHDAAHQPRLMYQLFDLTTNTMVDSFEKVANSSDPFFKTKTIGGITVDWRRTSCQRSPLMGRTGHKLAAIFVNTDCGYGGHFGYSYIDSLCDQNLGLPILNLPNKICINNDLLADGTQSVGVVHYTWTVVQCDQNGNNEVSSTSVSFSGNGAIVSPLDVTTLTNRVRHPLVCGHYYKVKLKIDTECTQGLEVSKVVYVDCCIPVEECCKDIKFGRDAGLRPTGRPGTFAFSLPLVGLPVDVRTIDFDIASASDANTGRNCPGGGPIFGYVSAAGLISGLNFASPVFPANPYSHIVEWQSPGTTVSSNPVLPVTLTFPPAPIRPCINYLRFCIKVSVKTKGCKSCEIYQWFYFRRTAERGGHETVEAISASQWPSGPRDREDGEGTVTREGGTR